MPEGKFSAAASALGYAYQFRYALLTALKRLHGGLSWRISLETADDVEVEGDGEDQLLQLKHRAPATSLTDSSSDLWKTLRVWCEPIVDGGADPTSTSRVLVTTATAPPESIGHLLRPNRTAADVAMAEEQLLHVAETSSNASLKLAFSAFSALPAEHRRALLETVVVLDNQPSVAALDDELRAACYPAVPRERLEPFLDRLEGWWFRRCLQQLVQPGNAAILAEELDSYFSDLREQFRAENLPIDLDVSALDADLESFESSVFVRQLELIDLSNKRIAIAVRDYMRAFTQRSRWARDGLLLVGELDEYERRLVEEWERHFLRMEDEIGASASEAVAIGAARDLYGWVESEADYPIRPECNEPFITRGSFQMLSDDRRVGWHPDFLARLIKLLEPASSS